jgi:hypothetical protein
MLQPQTAAPAQPTPQTQVQAASAAPAQPTAWPDALSRTHIQTPATPEAATPPSTPAAALAPDGHGQDDNAPADAANQPADSHTVADPKSTAVTAPAKRRVLISRTKQPKGDNASESADNTSAKARQVYDYYGAARDDGDRDDQGADTRSGGTALANVHLPHGAHNTRTAAPKTRVATKRQMQASPDRSDGSAAPQLPPQPRPSFLGGLFGGDRDDNAQ